MNEYEEMFRAFGWNNQDQIVHYDRPRRTYEEAQGDFGTCFAAKGVFSVGIEKRTVRTGTVTFVEDAPAVESTPEPVTPPVEPPAPLEKSKKVSGGKVETKKPSEVAPAGTPAAGAGENPSGGSEGSAKP